MRFRPFVRAWLVVPVLALAGTGCLATRGNIRLLQQDIRVLQGELVQAQAQTQQLLTALRAEADAARAAEARADSAQVRQMLTVLTRLGDSLSIVNDRLLALRAEVRTNQLELGEQLLQVYGAVGASQRALAQMRDQLESGGGTAAQDTSAAGSMPAVAALLEAARGQLRGGANATARGAYQDVLQRQDARPDQMAEALTGIAQSHEAEGNLAVADSIRESIPTRYPGTPLAANALYKHANYVLDTRGPAAARPIFDRITKEYGTSEEAPLAREKLRTLPQ